MRTTRIERRIVVVGLFITLTGAAPAQQFPLGGGRRADLDFVAHQLPALHPNFFTKVSREIYQQTAAALDAKLSTATDAEFYTGIAQLIAMGSDAHTSLNVSAAPFQFFPLRLRWFADGVFVTRASTRYTEALAARLVGIGDTPVDRVLERIATVIPHENDYWLHYLAPNYLINQTILQGLGLAPETSTTPLTFQSLGGREFTLHIDTMSAPLVLAVAETDGPIPLYQQNATNNYWYTYLPNDRLLYFRYNACVEMPSRPFASFAAALLSTLDANPVDTLVFDIRLNPGGNSGLIAPVFNGLAQRFPRLTENPRFRIYNVFNEGTFSSGLMNAEDLLVSYPRSIPNPNVGINLSSRVVSIGQATGGKPTHYGAAAPFVLPGSQIAGQRSTRQWTAPVGIPDDVALFPAVPVNLRSTDYFGRFDPVLAVILARGTGTPAGSSGDVITVNAASFRNDQAVAPGSFASAFGSFSTAPDMVSIGNETITPVISTNSQVNFLLPTSVLTGSATVTMLAGGRPLASGTVTIARSGPGLFVAELTNPSQPGAILNQDGTLNAASNPALPGSIVQIYATGYGLQPVTVYMAEKPVEILFSGYVPQLPGLWQINARVPLDVTGLVPLFVISDAQASNGVTVSVN